MTAFKRDRRHHRSRLLIIFAVLAAALAAAAYLPYRPQTLALELTAAETQNSAPEKATERTVEIHGEYRKTSKSSASFCGSIVISGYSVTKNEMLPLNFLQEDNGYASLSYRDKNGVYFVGWIRMERDGSEFILCLPEGRDGGTWSDTQGTVIAYPYTDRNALDGKLFG